MKIHAARSSVAKEKSEGGRQTAGVILLAVKAAPFLGLLGYGRTGRKSQLKVQISHISPLDIFERRGVPCKLLKRNMPGDGIEPPTRGFSVHCSTD
jgi:hypothetical protein